MPQRSRLRRDDRFHAIAILAGPVDRGISTTHDNLARFADRGGDAVPVHVGPQVRTDTREDRAQAGDER